MKRSLFLFVLAPPKKKPKAANEEGQPKQHRAKRKKPDDDRAEELDSDQQDLDLARWIKRNVMHPSGEVMRLKPTFLNDTFSKLRDYVAKL